ncbi:class I SAM-dependent methyltransferase [Persicitalea jodogahamensis]|uniref:SAM-dependent methyltransferase n=1 Tax=Persicitalea jodogahamensis TaxID=402147 RepID=A0A8J3DBZ2_9BACT|nr:class I SAM-dependent methyltransferase [Persicitalea jodogahamensis]GHB80554.1 SAM-dependent methyltransferase [Persicitalea jodogahamensis]
MVDNRAEYQRMHDLEGSLWWYQILHEKILRQINRRFTPADNPSILDAACGTGGLLSYLQKHGFHAICGFDYSSHGVAFSQGRGLDVSFGDLRKVADFRPGSMFDVVICNDALYFLNDQEIKVALTDFKAKLNPGGILLINIHAHEAFSGTHDVAVGSTRRFVLSDFSRYAKSAGLRISYHTYWPFILSLPIWLVREWQRRQIRRGKIDIQTLESDVQYPGHFLNSILHFITKTEQFLMPRGPFGSSLFLVLQVP